MFYYEIIIINHALAPLTYESKQELELFSFIKVSLRNKEVLALVWQQVAKPDFKTKNILARTSLKLTAIQTKLLKFISHYYSSELGVSAALFEPFNAELLENSKLSENSENLKLLENSNIFNALPILNEQQQKAFEFSNKQEISLIFGDTGCGKSEIYINAIAKVLNNGEQALLLMPEIALTPQMKIRLEKYFKGRLGIWHSSISKPQKKKLLEDFHSGKIRLIAGARSALFLPFTKLSLIIIDEEHDESYKNAAKPAYNARDLALYLAKNFTGVKTILGSATPSVTSYYKIPHFRLKGTYFKSSKEYIFDPSPLGLSKLIISHLEAVLKEQKQAVIFLPTRGNFKLLLCKECSASFSCPYCAVSMSLHKSSNALKCHYCGYSQPIPKTCDKCGGATFESQKIGTSELKELIQKALPNARIAKFDRDEITTAKKLEALLKNFNDGKIDILVGTQMLSKGHDYHNVAMAVILGLDEHLVYPDFRAQEKTLALAQQIAGRAGRASHGKIIIQTKQAEFFEKYLDNYDEFLKDELELRKPLYPPFARLLRILISHKNENLAQKIQTEIVNEIKNIAELEIIGFGRAGIAFIANKFRYEILLSSKSIEALLKAAFIAQKHGVLADIDPVNFS